MERGHKSTAQQWSSQHYFHCYLSQRSKDRHSKWDLRLFPCRHRGSVKFKNDFSVAVCVFQVLVGTEGTPQVVLKLQSIMCDCRNVTNTYIWQCTPTCLDIHVLTWMHSDTQHGVLRKERLAGFSGWKAHHHICNPSIWESTDYHCLSRASAGMLWRAEKSVK